MTTSAKASKMDGESGPGFSDAEKAAMKERAEELKAERRKTKVDPEQAVLEKIAEMPEPDRTHAQRIHEIVRETAPDLTPKLWYGFPTYARGKKNVCFFQPASKWDTRYSTFTFDEGANLDAGSMWPISYAILELTPADEEHIRELVKRAVS